MYFKIHIKRCTLHSLKIRYFFDSFERMRFNQVVRLQYIPRSKRKSTHLQRHVIYVRIQFEVHLAHQDFKWMATQDEHYSFCVKCWFHANMSKELFHTKVHDLIIFHHNFLFPVAMHLRAAALNNSNDFFKLKSHSK